MASSVMDEIHSLLTGRFCLRLLHHPSLDELSFLSGVTAVDDAVGSLHQFLDGGKLLLDAFIVDELDAEALWESSAMPKGSNVSTLEYNHQVPSAHKGGRKSMLLGNHYLPYNRRAPT